MTDDTKIVEVHDSKATVTEIAAPTKITGYFGYYRNLNSNNWQEVPQLPQKEWLAVLPYNAFPSRDAVLKAAMGISYIQSPSIKIVAVEFEV